MYLGLDEKSVKGGKEIKRFDLKIPILAPIIFLSKDFLKSLCKITLLFLITGISCDPYINKWN